MTYPQSIQTLTLYLICQNLTAMYLPIYIIRLNERTNNIYILAGAETGIIINPNGYWRYES
jgi:hypothetical protein